MADGPATPGAGGTYRLGVDLGTTFTAAAVGAGGAPWVLGLGNRALQVPSVVFMGPEGFLVGEAAERRGAAEPDRLVREFKRRLGDRVPLVVGGQSVTAEELMGQLLGWVVARAAERMGGPPGEVILTYPANWGPFKLGLLNEIVGLAGVGAWRGCPEPVAAAAQYAASVRVAVGDRLAVYDLGGGTFDACVLEKTEHGFGILGSPEGVERLGGVDFDEVVFRLVMDSLADRVAGLDPEDDVVTVGLARLRRECVEAKEALSSDADVVVPVSLPGLSTSVRVTRTEFESLIRPVLGETMAGLTRALRSASVNVTDMKAIVLVGGSSRIPLVGEMLQREFGVPTALDIHPKHDVALGAVRVGESGYSTGIGNAPAGAAAIPDPGAAAAAAGATALAGAPSGETTMPSPGPTPFGAEAGGQVQAPTAMPPYGPPQGQFSPGEVGAGQVPGQFAPAQLPADLQSSGQGMAADFQARQGMGASFGPGQALPPALQPDQMAGQALPSNLQPGQMPGRALPPDLEPGQMAGQFGPPGQAVQGAAASLAGSVPEGVPAAPATGGGLSALRRIPRLILIVLAAALVTGVASGVGYVYLPGSGLFGGGAVTTSPPESPSASESSGPSEEPSESPTETETASETPSDGLPRSEPLTDDQMLVPVRVDGGFDIYLGEIGNPSPVRAVIKADGDDSGPALSPDRATMIYSHDGTLRIAAVDGSQARDLFESVPEECAGATTRPAFDPADPTRVAIACQDADGNWGLYVIRMDGTVLKKLSNGNDRVGDAGYAPDGSHVVFWAAPADTTFDGGALMISDGSGKPRKLTNAATPDKNDADPAWSPDGSRIAFRHREVRTNADIFVVPADGSEKPTALTKTSQVSEQNPSWSPGSDEIAFKSTAASPDWPGATIERVWLMDGDGADQRVLWTEGVRDNVQAAPAWTNR